MEGHVSWVVELAVKDGALGAISERMEEILAGTSAEPATLACEWYISDDEKTVHIDEKYADSAATVSHAREIFDGFGSIYLGPWGGFSRFA